MVSLADPDVAATNLEPFRIFLGLADTVVSEVLVLETDEGLACEVTEVEGGTFIERELLAEGDVLLVENVDLVGDMGHKLRLFPICCLIPGQILFDKLISELVEVFNFCEIVADGDGGDKFLVEEIVVVGVIGLLISILVEDKLPKIFLKLVSALTFIFVVLDFLQPVHQFFLNSTLELKFVVVIDIFLGGVLFVDKLGNVFNEHSEVVLGNLVEVQPVPQLVLLLAEDQEENYGQDCERQTQDVDYVQDVLVLGRFQVVARSEICTRLI